MATELATPSTSVKPAQFEIREGAVAQPQDVVEGKMPIVVDTQAGVDVAFTTKDLTL